MPAFDFLFAIDVLGTAAFAISGARQAIDRRLDVFGVLVIAFVTSVGGGTLRDMLIGDLPVAWMRNELIITVIVIAAVCTMVVSSLHKRLANTLFLFDSLGLGLFTIVGLGKGLEAGFSIGISIALGTMSACFGGVIRDVLLNKVPLIFHKEIYASACIAGGLCYVALQKLGTSDRFAEISCISMVVIIRIVVVRYNLSMPVLFKSTSA